MPNVIIGKEEAFSKGFFFVDEVLQSIDFTNASFSGTSFDVSSEDGNPVGLASNTDGTKVFVIGQSGDDVHQYNLSTGFDASTASYSGTSFNLSGEFSFVSGLEFNGDGTKMFVSGLNDNISEYDLATAFDISTASFSGTSFSVSSEDDNPVGVDFNGDGTKMFVVGFTSESILKYNLSTGFDLSTASFSGTSFDVGSEEGDPAGIDFNGDGTEMFIAGFTSESILKYNLGTGFDLSTASFSGKAFDISSEDTSPQDLVFNGDGTKMLMVGDQNANVYEYTFGFSGGVEQSIDLTNASFSGTSFDISSEDDTPYGFTFNGDGTKMFMVGNGSNSVHEYDLTTGFDISTASFSGTSFDVISEDGFPVGLAFNSDGTKMFMVGNGNDNVYEYNLNTGFDLSTASYSSKSFDISSEDDAPRGVVFNGDGTKMFMIGDGDENVYEYDLSTGFDLSTSSYSGKSFDVSGEDLTPRGVTFNDDGTKMFMVGDLADSIFEYDLSTGFDVSTATYNSVSFDVSSEETGPQGLAFNGDGSKMLMVGDHNDNVYEYTL